MKKTCLFVGDGCVATGFARMNHAYINGLRSAGWDVTMLAINYDGDPHPFPFKVYPAVGRFGGHPFGMDRIKEMIQKVKPDVVFITQDPWNFPPYLRFTGDVPVVGSVAVDGMNCRGNMLNGLAHSIFWTQFGADQARLGGYEGPATVVPLGVDLSVFHPTDRAESRRRCGLPGSLRDKYIVGVVGRNHARKRIDLAMMYFAEWVSRTRNNDAYLFIHDGPTGDQGYDVDQLAMHLGIHNRVINSRPEIGHGMEEHNMRFLYSAFDCMLGVPQGEGWGLTHMEGMACGVAQILADWAALGEWARDAAHMIPCTSFACTPNRINAIGGIADKDLAIEALETVYRDKNYRENLGALGQHLVSQPQYRWDNIGARVAEVMDAVFTLKQAEDAAGTVEIAGAVSI